MSREERCECCGNEHGCCLRFREGWTPGSIYRPGDAVPLAGSSYIAIHPNQNDKPPSPNWALIAAKGDAGPPGSSGPAGPAGHDGATGQSGVSDAYALDGGNVELTGGRDMGSVTVPPGNYVIIVKFELTNADGDSQRYSVTLSHGGTNVVQEGGTLQEAGAAGFTTTVSTLAFFTTNQTTQLVLRGHGYKIGGSGLVVALPVGTFHSG